MALQIIRHLIPATTTTLTTTLTNTLPGLGFINTYQLFRLSRQVTSLTQLTQQVLNITTVTATLSGLGLVVSSLGFAAINQKLNAIDERLKAIQTDVRAIRIFLESAEHGRLYAALKEISNISNIHDPQYRDQNLLTAKTSLSEIHHKYKELLRTVTSLEMAIAYEEYFALTGLAYVRCIAELGEISLAKKELEEIYGFWKERARFITKELLIGKYPERFLASDFAQFVPIANFANWLEFAHDIENGYELIDDIRRNMNEPWFGTGMISFTGKGMGLNKAEGVGIENEQKIVVPTLQKLLARNNILEGYLAQYQTFETYNMRPFEFEQKCAKLPTESASNGYFILEPKKKVKVVAAE